MRVNKGRTISSEVSSTKQRGELGSMKIYSTDIQTKKYINTFTPIYLHTYSMYISNITHVNITNYLEISFQSVSVSVVLWCPTSETWGTARNESDRIIGTSGWFQSKVHDIFKQRGDIKPWVVNV